MTVVKLLKKRKPVLYIHTLDHHCEMLGALLLMSWLKDPKHSSMKNELSALFDALQKYLNQMKEQSERTQENRNRLEPVRSMKENWSLQSVKLGERQDSHPLTKEFDDVEYYKVIHLDEFLPCHRRNINGFIEIL